MVSVDMLSTVAAVLVDSVVDVRVFEVIPSAGIWGTASTRDIYRGGFEMIQFYINNIKVMHNAVVGVVTTTVIILLILWGSITTRLLVINLDETNKIDNYHNQTIDDLKRLIDSGDVESLVHSYSGLVEYNWSVA